MTAEAAVRVAMLRSPRLQQEYARLGLARADVLEAVQVSNPTLSLSLSYLDPGSGYNRLAGLTLPLADLLVLPMRTRLARAEFERAKLEIAGAVLNVAADVEAAWYTYVGAQQVADMRTAVAGGADAAAELAQRFFDAGNISELQLKQEQAAASEARIIAARARADASRARLTLNTLLGLSGEDATWATSDRLPMPVGAEDDPLQLAELARTSSLELLAARQQAAIGAPSHLSMACRSGGGWPTADHSTCGPRRSASRALMSVSPGREARDAQPLRATLRATARAAGRKRTVMGKPPKHPRRQATGNATRMPGRANGADQDPPGGLSSLLKFSRARACFQALCLRYRPQP